MRPMASETPNAVQRIVSQLPLTTVPFTMLNGSAAEKNASARVNTMTVTCLRFTGGLGSGGSAGVYPHSFLVPRETKRCASVEREFGRLKNEWALLWLRVRGIERVRLHADLTILAKLGCALGRARAASTAAA
jgi:hypothetical protein